MADTTTVFQSGNSQAVRLPKEYRFKSKTVEIFRRGDEVVLREKPRTMGDVLAEAWAGLPPLTEQDHADLDAMMAAIREPLPDRERDWQALLGNTAKPSGGGRSQREAAKIVKPSSPRRSGR